MQRDLRIDSLRGLFLVLMTMNHFGDFGGLWSAITWAPLGFVSSAEGFIFISGFVFTIVYSRYKMNSQYMIKKAMKRAFTIYKYHILLAVGIPFISFILPFFIPYWKAWLVPYYFVPVKTTIAKILLLHQPKYLDILPMYFIFILLSPFVIIGFHTGKRYIILLISFLLWLLSQFINPLQSLVDIIFTGHYAGYFNIFSWQILYFLGMFFGDLYYRGKKINILHNKIVLIFAAFSVVMLFMLRYNIIHLTVNFDFLMNRKNFASLLLFNFLTLATLVSFIISKIPKSNHIRWLAFIGKYSLQVFAFHVALLFFLAPLNIKIIEHLGDFIYSVYIIFIVLSLSIPAIIQEMYVNTKMLLNYKFLGYDVDSV